MADVVAVDRHAAALRVEEPDDQVDERRLAGAGRADDRDHLAGQRLDGHTAQHGLARVVAEPRVLHADVPPPDRQVARARGVVHVERRVEDLDHAVGLCRGDLEAGRGVRDLVQRPVQPRQVGEEDDDRPGREVAAHRRVGAQVHDRGGADRGRRAGEELEPHAGDRLADGGADRLVGVAAEALGLDPLAGERLHDRDRRQRLLDDRDHLALEVQTIAAAALHPPAEGDDRQQLERHDQQREQRQRRRQLVHDQEHRDEHPDAVDHGDEGAGQQSLHAVGVVPDTRDRVADRAPRMERDRQLLQVREDVAAQVVADALAQPRHRDRAEHLDQVPDEEDQHRAGHDEREERVLTLAGQDRRDAVEEARGGPVADDVVEQQLHGPRLRERERAGADQRQGDEPDVAKVRPQVAQQLHPAAHGHLPPRPAERVAAVLRGGRRLVALRGAVDRRQPAVQRRRDLAHHRQQRAQRRGREDQPGDRAVVGERHGGERRGRRRGERAGPRDARLERIEQLLAAVSVLLHGKAQTHRADPAAR